MNNTLKMVLVLSFVCIISALSLSFLYVRTQPKIEQNKMMKEIRIKQDLIPNAEKFVTKSLSKDFYIEECYNKTGELIGLIVSSSCQGYAGEIEYLVAITTYTPVRIISLKVLSHKETPGLGANVSKDKFLLQFAGKTANQLQLSREIPEGEIDAITGATITSRAITNSLKNVLTNEKLTEFLNKLELVSSSFTAKPKPKTAIVQPQDLYKSTASFVQE